MLKFNRHLTSLALSGLLVFTAAGCGLESDGSHKETQDPAPTVRNADIGRFKTEAVRLGVARPLFLLIDTATGQVLQRHILGSQKFRPVTPEPGPGADLNPLVSGRYDVKVVPGRRGSALLRLDSVTGKTWFAQLDANQSEWYAIPSSLDDAPQKPQGLGAGAASEAPSRRAGRTSAVRPGQPQTKKPTLKSLLDVLTDPNHEPELRIWTAGHLAEVYPVEAVEMLGTTLEASEPKVIVAIVETVKFDSAGRVKTALEALRGHEDARVAKALSKKLGS